VPRKKRNTASTRRRQRKLAIDKKHSPERQTSASEAVEYAPAFQRAESGVVVNGIPLEAWLAEHELIDMIEGVDSFSNLYAEDPAHTTDIIPSFLLEEGIISTQVRRRRLKVLD
jgi:hypothetical protein